MKQIEQSTIYAYKLKYLENPNFDKIRSFAKNFIDELPQDLQSELYEKINRGIDQLETEPEMLVYLYSFGNMHQAKLNYAFEHLPDFFFEQSEINIIDYGCGQAIGTMCYVDFLKRENPNQKIKSVTLIEPSEICLKRAGLHTSVFLPETEIRLVNKTFDQLSDDDVVCDENIPTLHILSNVLDLDFDLPYFSSLINRNIKGYNQFVCVGPYFNYSDKDQRMQEFAESLNGDVSFAKMLEKGELSPLKSWTCQAVVFSLGKLEENLSTEVTENEIENGVEDEYGVVYSKDGKRLLEFNPLLTFYAIKDGTKVIVDDIFWGCDMLQEIIIPKSLKKIGVNSFCYCSPELVIKSNSFRFVIEKNCLIDNIEKTIIHYMGNEPKISIPDTIRHIGGGAFADNKSLEQIKIPNSVTTIGVNAFLWCESLQSVVIPNTVNRIDDGAFLYCKSLTKISIPNSVTIIGRHPFPKNCVISSKSSRYIVERGFLIDNKEKTILHYSGFEKEIIIPDTIINIGIGAFEGCISITSVVIPTSVVTIEDRAFEGCKSLQQIVIPNSVTSIGSYAFYNCESLQQVVLSNTITTIKEYTFCKCTSLMYVLIPNTVSNIERYAFATCKSLICITIPDSVIRIGQQAFLFCESLQKINNSTRFIFCNGCLIDNVENHFLFYVGKEKEKKIIIPDSVKQINDYAFGGCETVQQIIIPNSVTCIEKNAFVGVSIKSILIPKGTREKFEKITDTAYHKLLHESNFYDENERNDENI